MPEVEHDREHLPKLYGFSVWCNAGIYRFLSVLTFYFVLTALILLCATIQELRLTSHSIKQEILKTQESYSKEFNHLGGVVVGKFVSLFCQ